MSPEATTFLAKVKATRDEFVGVDATHLSNEDRRELASLGVSFARTRKHGQIVGTYTAARRAEDRRATMKELFKPIWASPECRHRPNHNPQRTQ